MVVQNTCHKDIPEDNEVVDNHENGIDVNGRQDRVSTDSRNTTASENSDEEPEENDLIRLKELIPSVSAKDNVTQLDIILEAIRYIDNLKNKLADKLENGEIELVKIPVSN